MELVFRKLPPAESLDPQPGEVYLLPALKEQRHRRDLAKFVLEQGSDALLQGAGAPVRIVLDADPKFDDMLAALFAYQKFQNRPVPPGCKVFAEYAAQLREGLRPTSMSLPDSIEGIFLAIRGNAEKSLTDPETAKHFLSDWGRLAGALLKAAEQTKDPFTASLFDPLADYAGERHTVPLKSINRAKSSVAAGVGFLREQAFLVKDLEVYRQDFARGERWQVRLPNGPPVAPGLLLRKPKSLLFKYWTRSPCPPPLDGPYLFIAVTASEGQWIFSTEPKQKANLQSLAELLQAAERKQTPGRADHDPWFDGKSMQYAVVASPRGGTRLSENTVLGIVKKWCRARPLGYGQKILRRSLVAGCFAALVIAAAVFVLAKQPDDKKDGKGTEPAKVHPAIDFHDLVVLSVGVSKYQNLDELKTAAHDADAIVEAFKKLKGAPWEQVRTKALKDKEATREGILDIGLGNWLLKQQTNAHSLVIVTFSGHGLIDPATKRYQFAPQDFDLNRSSSGIFLQELDRFWRILGCTVVLILDTCHSGADGENPNDELTNPDNLVSSIQKSVAASGSKQGLVVMAACGRYQKATETSRWGHGAMTLALLEGIEGKYLYQGEGYKTPLPKAKQGGTITLQDLDTYMTDRVQVLSTEMSDAKFRQQATRTSISGGISLEQIPIVRFK